MKSLGVHSDLSGSPSLIVVGKENQINTYVLAQLVEGW